MHSNAQWSPRGEAVSDHALILEIQDALYLFSSAHRSYEDPGLRSSTEQ